MKNASYLDRLARYEVDGAHPGGLALTRELLRKEKITPNTILLDIGCGTGQTSAYIAACYPGKVIAVDINPLMVEKARQKFTRYQLDIQSIQADAADLPFRKNSFDIVLSESVTVFTDIRRTLREYFRVLKPGGVLLAIEVTAFLPLSKDETSVLQETINIAHLPTRDEWSKMFQETGFSDVQVLSLRRMKWIGSSSLQLKRAFYDYLSVMRRYRGKIGFGVYRCTS